MNFSVAVVGWIVATGIVIFALSINGVTEAPAGGGHGHGHDDHGHGDDDHGQASHAHGGNGH
jgi:hypothetical protein